MPELPEVEVVRAGLAPAVAGARVLAVEVRDPRALKRHVPLAGGGARGSDFERRLTGARLLGPVRRGKFMWVPLAPDPVRDASVRGAARAHDPGDGDDPGRGDDPAWALLAHLGMSGQLLLRAVDAPDDRHVRVRIWIEHPEHGELRVDFADQRLFGSLAIEPLVPTEDGAAGGSGSCLASLPAQAAHIARDPLDPAFDDSAFVRRLRSRAVGVKAQLLDQTLLSGVGNIYADETLWRARVHPETPGSRIGARTAAGLLVQAREVFAQALVEGGTSFDAQYVNVNGQAGYFARSLQAYGRTGEPCPRCGTLIRRVVIGGRSSHFCPRCQRRR